MTTRNELLQLLKKCLGVLKYLQLQCPASDASADAMIAELEQDINKAEDDTPCE